MAGGKNKLQEDPVRLFLLSLLLPAWLPAPQTATVERTGSSDLFRPAHGIARRAPADRFDGSRPRDSSRPGNPSRRDCTSAPSRSARSPPIDIPVDAPRH